VCLFARILFFESADIDAMLGREDWNGEIFEVYVDRLHEIMPIALFRETGHGRKSPRDVAADGDWEIDDTITFSQVPGPAPVDPKPAGQHDKGLDVYFYYGVCEGGKVSIGSNTVVYRSVDDIMKKRQVYAPFNDLKFGDDVDVNSMYGLSENGCSLNYMGVSMFPKGDEKWFDWDGHECKGEGILKLN